MPREGYKMTELGELPNKWEVASLGKYAKMIVPMRDKPKDLSGCIPWIRIEDINGKYLYGSKSSIGVSKETIEQMNLKVFPINTVLCSCSCSMGVCAITKKELISNQTFIGIVASKGLSFEFLYFLMTSYSDDLQKISTGTTIDYLSRQKFENLQIPLPPLPEQHHIAEILTTMDETIEHTKTLIEKYQYIKKGLMADLLIRGIDEKGKIRSEETHRFKDSTLGRIPEEWDVVELGKVSELINGRAYKLSEWEEHGTPVIRIQNLTETGEKYYYSNLNLPEKQYAHKGELLYAWSGTYGAYIWHGTKAIFHYHIWRINIIGEILQSFLYIILNYITADLKSKSHGGLGLLHITKENMEKYEFQLPSLYEQHFITEMLTAADERIEKEEAYRNKLLQIKKGLMQDLLTGRVRVKVPQEVEA